VKQRQCSWRGARMTGNHSECSQAYATGDRSPGIAIQEVLEPNSLDVQGPVASANGDSPIKVQLAEPRVGVCWKISESPRTGSPVNLSPMHCADPEGNNIVANHHFPGQLPTAPGLVCDSIVCRSTPPQLSLPRTDVRP
jgi:hypothetical protein